MLDQYKKQVRKYAERSLIRLDTDLPPPSPQLLFSICIPMRNEPNPTQVLEDLYSQALERELFEVIVLVNEVEEAQAHLVDASKECYETLIRYKKASGESNLHILLVNNMPKKKGGVGLARKMAMDTAWNRYLNSDTQKGLLVALDADCHVSDSYLRQLKDLSCKAPAIHAFSFDFHHDLSQEPENGKAILEYELHLRLYRECLLEAGHPHSQYTVGSSMACTVLGYSAMGGMNTRKAGEDFYFLHKFIRSGYHTFYPDIVVYPSNRYSDRVPFGTGRAMLSRKGDQLLLTYHIDSYRIIEQFIQLSLAYLESGKVVVKYPSELVAFLSKGEWETVMKDIKAKTSSKDLYEKKFFEWFDAFKAMKMLHFLKDNISYLSNQPVQEVAQYYLLHYKNRENSEFRRKQPRYHRINALAKELKLK